ncbi:MAG TPA: PQQ-binding-like beta-propeller repeat protein, partial [Chloroflexota bacterium]|nr:PQQ-binding-like beta-propeller repeat protein [Chloroflexota bacterium]
GRIAAAVALGLTLLPSSGFAQAVPTTRPTQQELASTTAGGKDWITFGGALNNQRYSTLNQVTAANVQTLKGAWMTRLGSGRGAKYRFEPDPLVIDGVMYVPTGNDDIFALDGKTGKKIWEYFSDIPQVNDLVCCGWDNRGVAAGEGKIFSGQLDGSLVALDQKTGKIAWRTQLEDYRDGYSITGANRYFDGLVFTGMSGGENGIQGRFYALDAKTGQVVWRFNTVPNPGEFGSDSWPAGSDIYKHGGGTVWQAPAIDPELGMLYFSTGNAGPWEGSLRPGQSLFTSSIVALDIKTGAYKWHFQEVHHDIWDYDLPNPPAIYDTVINGQPRKGLYQASKTGWLYFLDRTNGQPLIGIDEKPVPQDARQQTWATQPIPQGDAFVRQCPEPDPNFAASGCIFTPWWDVPTLLTPSASGGSNFNPTCYNPNTGLVYVMGVEQDTAYSLRDIPFVLGKVYTRVNSSLPLGHNITSTFTAMDSKTNKIAWQERKPGADSKGCVTTAGGLTFVGQIDGNFVAFDAASGNKVWSFQTGWGIGAPPMTYEIDGKQYIAVASGGNRGGVTTLDGDAIWSFSLDGTLDQVPSPPPVATKVEITGRIVNIGDTVATPGNIGDDRIFQGTLEVFDYDFLPRRVTVPAGTAVSWQNTGATIHTATDTKVAWDTGDIRPGETASVTFNTPGTFTYTCSPHPWMLGQVIVQ